MRAAAPNFLRQTARLVAPCVLAGLTVLAGLPESGLIAPPWALAQPEQSRPDQPRPDQLRPDQPQPDQFRPGQAVPVSDGTAVPAKSLSPPAGAPPVHRSESRYTASPAPPRKGDTDPADNIVIATLDWPPYVERYLPHGGYAVQVIRAALASGGVAARFEFMPWSRAVAQLREGKVAAIAPEYRTVEREVDCDFSAPFPGGTLVLLGVAGNERHWNDLRELAGLRIGVVRGYVHTDAFDAATFLRKEPANDELANIRKLLAGRIDAMAADRNVVRFLLRRDLPAQTASVAEFDPVLGERDLHVCFSRARPDHAALRAAFDKGLAATRAAGLVDTLHREMHRLAVGQPAGQ